MRRFISMLFAAGLVTVLPMSQAQAACALCTCGVSSTGFDFGSYNPLDTFNLNGSGRVAVTCSLGGLVSLGVSYEIKIGTGQGTFSQRKMTMGANALNYNLYTTSGRTTVWGDGTGSTGTVSDAYLLGLGAGTTSEYTVWGRIPMQQNVPMGSYSDSVVLTVIY